MAQSFLSNFSRFGFKTVAQNAENTKANTTNLRKASCRSTTTTAAAAAATSKQQQQQQQRLHQRHDVNRLWTQKSTLKLHRVSSLRRHYPKRLWRPRRPRHLKLSSRSSRKRSSNRFLRCQKILLWREKDSKTLEDLNRQRTRPTIFSILCRFDKSQLQMFKEPASHMQNTNLLR